MSKISSYSEEMAQSICAWIADGKPLREFCRQEGNPAWRTVYDWLAGNEDFAARFARARDIGADAIAEGTLEIADNPQEGVETIIKADGSREERRGDMLGHRKLQIETRLKLLAKWNPKKYGEKVSQEISGPNGAPIRTETNVPSLADFMDTVTRISVESEVHEDAAGGTD